MAEAVRRKSLEGNLGDRESVEAGLHPDKVLGDQCSVVNVFKSPGAIGQVVRSQIIHLFNNMCNPGHAVQELGERKNIFTAGQSF